MEGRDGKAEILARVRAALSVPTDPAVRHARGADRDLDWLPTGGADYAAWRSRFADFSGRLKTQFIPVDDLPAATRVVRDVAARSQVKAIAAHHAPLIEKLCQAMDISVCWTDGGYDPRQLEKCQLGITTCEALIAQTGSILVSSRSNGGRAVSVLPPHHIVVATRHDLLPDIDTAFARVRARYGQDYPSMLSLITGPSRTGDIERILVLGAHGPRELTVILIEAYE
jgi:L-lactate dehydrogenase complex protein LldG